MPPRNRRFDSLSETGEVIVLNEDVLLSADAFAQMKSRIAQALQRAGAGHCQ